MKPEGEIPAEPSFETAPSAAPIMDVTPPETGFTPTAIETPVMSSVPEVDPSTESQPELATPPATQEEGQPQSTEDQAEPAPVVPKPMKVQKTPGNGTGPAIMATVVIVLILAVLVTMAYLKTSK